MFVLDRDVDKILNTIHAYIAGVPFPYPGNDQTDACKNMYSEDGKNFVGCPLKKGQDYLYKNDMEVLQIYPRVRKYNIITTSGYYPDRSTREQISKTSIRNTSYDISSFILSFSFLLPLSSWHLFVVNSSHATNFAVRIQSYQVRNTYKIILSTTFTCIKVKID